MERMQTYQGDVCMEDPNAPLPAGMKLIDQEDYDRLEAVETVEELKDVYDHFLLYHAKYLAPCREHFKKESTFLKILKDNLQKIFSVLLLIMMSLINMMRSL